jgi:hypothetical protein
MTSQLRQTGGACCVAVIYRTAATPGVKQCCLVKRDTADVRAVRSCVDALCIDHSGLDSLRDLYERHLRIQFHPISST